MIKKNCLSCKYGYDFYKDICRCSKESADSNIKYTDLTDNCPNYKEELWQIYWKRVWRLKGEVVTNNYTTQSQSRKLLEHGLDPSTADMIWTYDFMAGEITCVNIISDLLKPESPDIPAWSLSQLLNMLPEKIVIGDVGGFEVEYHLNITKHEVGYYIPEGNGNKIFSVESKKYGLLECLVKTIIWLLEKGTQLNGNILSC
jgi:hypothetical protein